MKTCDEPPRVKSNRQHTAAHLCSATTGASLRLEALFPAWMVLISLARDVFLGPGVVRTLRLHGYRVRAVHE